MTKKQLAQRIISQKSGGNTAMLNKYDVRELYIDIEAAFAETVKKFKLAFPTEFYAADFIKKYKIKDMYYDSSRDETFFVLPVQIIDDGLLGVSPPQGTDYILQKSGAATLYDELEAGVAVDNLVCIQEGDRVYFQRSGKIHLTPTIRCIPAGSAYKESEQLPIPAIYESYVVDKVTAFLDGQRAVPYKKVLDNNPNTI